MSDITIPDNVYEYCKDRASVIATDWMSDIVSAIQDCNVLSPIEQLFFIEWQYQERYTNDLGILPQWKIEIEKNVYYIDFMVQFDYLYSKIHFDIIKLNKIELPKIAIELEDLIEAAMRITSFALYDAKKAKIKMKELTTQTNLPPSLIRKAVELAKKRNYLLSYLI